MKDRKLEIDENKITGFLDKETEIKGELNFKGSFRIDGNFKGNINSDSTLIIGENGKLEADLNVGHVIINGEIKGNIQAKEKVIINSSGRVIGTITTPILVVEEGAYLETNCQTVDKISRSMPEKSKERTP
jgi:cytoskeletal protein CcmA (bactofilin family)